jgi:UPF0755 protein
MRRGVGRTLITCLAVSAAAACSDERQSVEVTVPPGAGLSQVADSLSSRAVIRAPGLFQVYARIRGDDHRIKAGRYEFRTRTSWGDALGRLTRGEVMTVPMTIPEGFQLSQMVDRIAEVTGRPADAVATFLTSDEVAARYDLPGPTAEGYLFPDTYRFARGVDPGRVVDAMIGRYRAVWTAERRSRADSLGMTEQEIITLASIIQAEARKFEEMPLISGVYHHRLRIGWLLQADPTVLYALGGTRERLLYAAIDSVAENPYNTYTQAGLPPGPIGAPGEAAIDAALNPVDDYLYFVAWPDGSHVFTRSLVEHNRAKADAQRAREAEALGN